MSKCLTERLDEIEEMLANISRYPWRCEKTSPGEWWITAPDDSDHSFRNEYEPIFESSGTIPQLGIDGDFIAQAPQIIEWLLKLLREK